MTFTTATDPVTLEILSHRLHQIACEMGITLERVGGTVNTTQQHDYMAALYRANGDVLAAGESEGQHVACAGFAVKQIIGRFQDDAGIYPDDIFLLNDPYVAAIHQSDVYVISPIHFDGRLVAWSATFVHVMDIGALSPGGNSPAATEICHEGVRIPGLKLVERGLLRRDVFDTVINMTRQPIVVGLDLKCEIAANNVAKARVQEMCAHYGPDLVDAVSAEMIRYSQTILQQRLRDIPDGRWSDTGLVQADEDSWHVVLTLHKRGDRLIFDFTGTDPQARRGINLPYHATLGVCYSAVLMTLAYDIPRNHGALLPIDLVAPEGTIVNPRYPAPVSLNTTSGFAIAGYLARSCLAQMLAASQEWKREVMGAVVGHRFARHAGVNQQGSYYVSSLSERVNGSGARAVRDGIDSAEGGWKSCHNVEWVESNFPLLYLFRRHVRDAAGAGMFRRGVGVEVALALHDAPEGRIKGVALGVAGLRNSGQGLFGGYPAAPSLLVLLNQTKVNDFWARGASPVGLDDLGGERTLLPYCEFQLGQDDVLYMRMGSGGGYGDPLDRDPEAVRRDVVDGLVSSAGAERIYGVVIDPDSLVIVEEATRACRAVLRSARREEQRARGPHLGREVQANRTQTPAHRATKTDPLRENLEVYAEGADAWIRCARCLQILCSQGDDWKAACRKELLPPTEAGPLMGDLVGQFLIEQIFCPSCGVLLNTDLREAN